MVTTTALWKEMAQGTRSNCRIEVCAGTDTSASQ